jgi:hypothetical protein
MNKRDFILAGCSTLGSGVVIAHPVRPAHADLVPMTHRLARFPDLQASAGLATWHRYVGERFRQFVRASGKEVVLRRIVQRQVDEHGEQFTLLFSTSVGAGLQAGTHPLRHDTTGQQVQVFLQPAGHDLDGMTLYRADFNRLG